MKTASFLLTLIGCGALLRSPCMAEPSARSSERAIGPGGRQERSGSRIGHERTKPGASVLPPSAAKPGGLRPSFSPSEKPGEIHRPAAAPGGLAKERVAPKTTVAPKIENAPLPRRSPTQLASLQASPVHNRGPALATLGGLMASSAARSTAALNGTGFTHKR